MAPWFKVGFGGIDAPVSVICNFAGPGGYKY